jgi:hypothetical protein
MNYSHCFEEYSTTYILGAAISSGLTNLSADWECCVLGVEREGELSCRTLKKGLNNVCKMQLSASEMREHTRRQKLGAAIRNCASYTIG